ncbi:transketolase [Thermosulfuriphilus sp.]
MQIKEPGGDGEMLRIDLSQESLSAEQIQILQGMWRRCARRIILATTLAGCGHPGGSLSSLHLLLMSYALMRHDPQKPRRLDRDRLLISHGHISPAAYSVLVEYGYVSEEAFLMEFRRAGSAFAGHVEQTVPGIEWNTGNLGQGLSAACGLALSLKLNGLKENRVLCLMGDGEQQKGQVIEARRFAVKFGLNNLIVLVDRNHLQIGGDTDLIIPQSLRDEYRATYWNVIYLCDGHDFPAIYRSLRQAWLKEVENPARPTAILARTVMGKGISFMENVARWHGEALKPDLAQEALRELGFEDDIEALLERRRAYVHFSKPFESEAPYPEVDPGQPILYGPEVKMDNRSAYGKALRSLAEVNNIPGKRPKILGFSCDLEGSVKMTAFRQWSPEAFFESGIQEHHAATAAGAASREGFVVFFSTFGVFAVCETYNQHRLNDLNHTHLKVVSTHLGLDVGEDGPTHQCLDYLGLLQNLFGFSIFLPADPNQTDRIIRYVARTPGNFFVGMGRSKTQIILDEAGRPFFSEDYEFKPGQADWIRRGDQGTFICFGPMVVRALEAREILAREGISVGVLNMASFKPLDVKSIMDAALIGPIVTAEDHVVDTGLGAAVARVLADSGVAVPLKRCGVSHYGSSGKPDDLYRRQGLDPESLAQKMKKLIAG